jgi:hypothetical protein
MKAIGDRVKVNAESSFSGELGTVAKVFPAETDSDCVDGYGVVLDSDEDPYPLYFAHYELESETGDSQSPQSADSSNDTKEIVNG